MASHRQDTSLRMGLRFDPFLLWLQQDVLRPHQLKDMLDQARQQQVAYLSCASHFAPLLRQLHEHDPDLFTHLPLQLRYLSTDLPASDSASLAEASFHPDTLPVTAVVSPALQTLPITPELPRDIAWIQPLTSIDAVLHPAAQGGLYTLAAISTMSSEQQTRYSQQLNRLGERCNALQQSLTVLVNGLNHDSLPSLFSPYIDQVELDEHAAFDLLEKGFAEQLKQCRYMLNEVAYCRPSRPEQQALEPLIMYF